MDDIYYFLNLVTLITREKSVVSFLLASMLDLPGRMILLDPLLVLFGIIFCFVDLFPLLLKLFIFFVLTILICFVISFFNVLAIRLNSLGCLFNFFISSFYIHIIQINKITCFLDDELSNLPQQPMANITSSLFLLFNPISPALLRRVLTFFNMR